MNIKNLVIALSFNLIVQGVQTNWQKLFVLTGLEIVFDIFSVWAPFSCNASDSQLIR